MKSKDHLVPQELREMPDKWKEKQPKTCVGKDLIPSLSFPLSLSHTDKNRGISISWPYIIWLCNTLEGDT